MVEILHRFNGSYPFGLQKDDSLTFVDLRKQSLSEQQISDYRLKYKILKELICPNIMRLVKIMKDDNNMHLLYEYYPLSLAKYIEITANRGNTKNQNVLGHQFLNTFIVSISQIIESLIHFQIKAELLITNIAVEQNQDKEVVLKMFINPDFDCIGLRLPFSTEQPDIIKKKIQQSRANLREYYNNEKNNLLFELQQLIKDQSKKIQQVPDKNIPNFVIKGTKLVFIKKGKQQKEGKKSFNQNQQQDDNNETNNETGKIEKAEGKKDLKQKNLRKIEEIKNTLNHLNHKNKHTGQDIPEEQSNFDTKLKSNNDPLDQEVTFKSKDIHKHQIIEEKSHVQSEKLQNYKRKIHERPMQQKRQPQSIPEKKAFKDQKQQQIVSVKLSQFKSDNTVNKQGKGNKYKMKIITSKQVQVMGIGDKKGERIEKYEIQQLKPSVEKSSKKQKQIIQHQKKSDDQLEGNQKQPKTKQTVKLCSSDIVNSSKKMNELINKLNVNQKQIKHEMESPVPEINSKLNVNSNSTQSHTESLPTNQQMKGQTKISKQNTLVVEVDSFAEKYQDKIKDAKNKAKQVLKDYAKSQNAMNSKQP